MIVLPDIDDRLFPKNSRQAIAAFWLAYWGHFFLFLPWMLLRQAQWPLRVSHSFGHPSVPFNNFTK